MASHSIIAFADLGPEAPQPPSLVANAIMQAARDSLSSGQFEVAAHSMTAADVRRMMLDLPSGHERLSQDRNLILLGAAAVFAYAPYRGRAVLLDDPFDQVDHIAHDLDIDADAVRIRLHEGLCTAETVTVLSSY